MLVSIQCPKAFPFEVQYPVPAPQWEHPKSKFIYSGNVRSLQAGIFANMQRQYSLSVAQEPVSGRPLLFPNEFFRIVVPAGRNELFLQ